MSLLPPSFLDSYSQYIDLMHRFLVLRTIFKILYSSTSRMVPTILQGGQPERLSLWLDFYYIVWFPVVFSFSGDTLFHFFFHCDSFDGVCFQYSQVFFFFLLNILIFSWFGSSIPSVMCRLLLFIIIMAQFYMESFIPML